MRVWADIYDASGNRLVEGPVESIVEASVDRALDGAGQFNLRAVGTDPRALELITNERRIQLWGQHREGEDPRLLGEGIIRKVDLIEQETGVVLRASGPDILNELKRKNVLLARIYNQATVAAVAAGLIGLVSGWSVDVDSSISGDLVDARYDGVSVLKAFQDLAKRYGYHLRMSDEDPKTLEIGPFGEDNGLRIFKVETITQETLASLKNLMVQRIQIANDSEEIYNWLLPLGAGEGVAALTLEKSTRSSPYTIQSMAGPDGTTLYYIKDATAIAAYGQIEKVAQFKDIAPLTNTDTDVENAANALYDAAVEWLLRHKDPQEAYMLRVKNAKEGLRTGDKIHVNYKAQVQIGGTLHDYISIRDDFWILKATERVTVEGCDTELEISNLDRPLETAVVATMNSIEAIEMRGLRPQQTSSARSYVYDREIAPSFEAAVPVEFTDATLAIQRIRMRLKTTPFRATAKTAKAGDAGTTTSSSGGASSPTTAGSAHQHSWSGLPASPPGYTYTEREFSMFDTDGNIWWLKLKTNHPAPPATVQFAAINENPPHTHVVSIPAHTHEVTIPDHVHDLEFGISDDTETPEIVTVLVNGEDKTYELFGSAVLAPSGGNLNEVADTEALTDLIVNASGGFRQAHEIVVQCQDGQGRVEVTVEIFEVTQAIKV